ncbi:hypothetical protein AWB79_07602 [Caballeronia hypogeia]|uniref:Uncharacterized protein n=1 Tax=Caballeronia hypogeia TaxID=1777140 RepID=A0A158DV72_9BURK|nr:hypothetical protein AWB79_07602 [Caballeronia hypogeia]
MATEQTIRIFQVVEAFARRLIAAVRDEAIGLQQARRAHELVRVPPEARARGRAARAQNALVETVELVALHRRLQALLFRRRRVIDQIRLDRMILVEELREVADQVAHHRQTRQRTQHDLLRQFVQIRQTGEAVLAVDVHRIGPAHAFAARATERQRFIEFFQLHQRVEQHALMRQIQLVRLHARRCVLVRIVAIDFKNSLCHFDSLVPCLRRSVPSAAPIRPSAASSAPACSRGDRLR